MAGLSEIVNNYSFSELRKDFVMQFGNENDGVIGIPGLTKENGVIELSYFYGDAKPKNIAVISSQIGCPARCHFCELGNDEFVRSLSAKEMYEETIMMLKQASQYSIAIDSVKHKVTVANSGEPLFNKNLVDGLEQIAKLQTSFKVSTVFPAGKKCRNTFEELAKFAAHYAEPVQLQISLISTAEEQRQRTAGIPVASFNALRDSAEYWRNANPAGRKINLSLILDNNTQCDAAKMRETFPPELFRFRFRPYVATQNGAEHRLTAIDYSALEQIKASFQEQGYEVGDWALPTSTEQKFGLASNIIRKRYMDMLRN